MRTTCFTQQKQWGLSKQGHLQLYCHSRARSINLLLRDTALLWGVGWVFLYMTWSYMLCVALLDWSLDSKESVQHTTALIFSLNRWFNRAYTKGLAAELNKTKIWVTATATGLMLMGVKVLKTYTVESAPQHTPNMALTVAAIRVTRFRSLMTPCVMIDRCKLFIFNFCLVTSVLVNTYPLSEGELIVVATLDPQSIHHSGV